jgi:hypothetical protein
MGAPYRERSIPSPGYLPANRRKSKLKVIWMPQMRSCESSHWGTGELYEGHFGHGLVVGSRPPIMAGPEAAREVAHPVASVLLLAE